MKLNLNTYEAEMLTSLMATNKALYEEFGERVDDIGKQFIYVTNLVTKEKILYKYRSDRDLERVESPEYFESFNCQKRAIEAYFKFKKSGTAPRGCGLVKETV